ncbi:phospholipase C/P1 nuclease [Lojkania enalia]|uniref:Phospholipase C/P1 nuclease n=1 Tax=Lojkania enalia TaxID=147567 RepID=A0A9P4N700_9PLEO|nr:phospholipase C/P1 nuclease [Didymosphaeria enalia]
MNIMRALLGGLLVAPTAAWYVDVHNQIGFMAEKFLNKHATSVIQDILEPQYNGSIGRAAAWADAYAHTHEGRYSYNWHFIDTEDDPPSNCTLNYAEDCSSKGCVVSAIQNQTNILKGCIEDVYNGSLRGGINMICSYALKWVVHFIGDITQPLHASGLALGGNRFNVTFGNITTNLHSVWDGHIVYLDANVTQFSNASIAPFFEKLVSRIYHKDDFVEPRHEWLSCSDPSTPLTCALHWAHESNMWNCRYVYSQIHNNVDLASSGYAVGAFPIVELQISKAALRLGTWLNKLVGEVMFRPRNQKILKNDHISPRL